MFLVPNGEKMSKCEADKNVSQNLIFSPLRVGTKTIEN